MSSKQIILMMAALMVSIAAHGQLFPERKHIREGNRLYEKQSYADAEKAYRKGLQKDSLSVEGIFNLGDTNYATGNFAGAEEQFRKVTELNEGVSNAQKAAAYYNLGNAQFQQQKLQEALEAYKKSLKLNPSDLEAKFNYAYTKALLDQQQQNEQQQNNQDQQQNQQQDQNQQGDNQQQNQQQQPQNGDQEQQQQPEQPQGDKPKPSEGSEQEQQPQAGPSKESEQMLNAVQSAEDKTREKVEGERAVGVARSGKNW